MPLELCQGWATASLHPDGWSTAFGQLSSATTASWPVANYLSFPCPRLCLLGAIPICCGYGCGPFTLFQSMDWYSRTCAGNHGNCPQSLFWCPVNFPLIQFLVNLSGNLPGFYGPHIFCSSIFFFLSLSMYDIMPDSFLHTNSSFL